VLECTHRLWHQIGPSYTFEQRATEILDWVRHPPKGIGSAVHAKSPEALTRIEASLRSNVIHEAQRSRYYESRLKDARRALDEVSENHVSLQRRLEHSANERDELERQLTESRSLVSALSSRATDAERRLQDGQEQWSRATQHWESAAKQVQRAQQQLNASAMRAGELEGRLKATQAQLSDARDQYTTKLQEFGELGERHKALEGRLATTEAQLSEVRDQYTAKLQEFGELDTRYMALERVERRTLETLKEAETAATTERKAHAACLQTIRTLEEQLQEQRSLEAANRALSARVESLQAMASSRDWAGLELKKYLLRLERVLQSVLSSTSWRTMAPLRTTKLRLMNYARGKQSRCISIPPRPEAVERLLTDLQTGRGRTGRSSQESDVLPESSNKVLGKTPAPAQRAVGDPANDPRPAPKHAGSADADADYWRLQAYLLVEELEAVHRDCASAR